MTTGIKTELLGGNLFRLLEPVEFTLGPVIDISVPVGFVTDFASVPYVLQWWVRPTDDRAVRGAVVHDWIYHTHILPRCIGDSIFQVMLRQDGMSRHEANAFTYGVHVGGKRSYMDGPDKLRARTPHLAKYIKDTPEIE